MKLLGDGWEKLLANFFDHTVTFYSPTRTQDETGQEIEGYELAEGFEDMPCVVSDRTMSKTENEMNSWGSYDSRVVLLLQGAHPEICINWKAVVDGTDVYRVKERTPSQSEDVSEIPVERWT